MALPRNPLETFIWGQGGVAMTPEQVAREREIAAALSDQGADFSPVGHWLEGAARLGHSAAGAFRDWRASEGERAGREGFSDRWSSVFGGGGSSPVAEALASSVSPTALDAANAAGQAAPTTSSFSGGQQEFIDMLLPAALEVSAETGIDPRIIIAQAAQETGWGRSAPGNNFFGIKSHGRGGGQTLNTHEYIDGQRVNVSDSFRTFASPEDSVRGYGEFIRANPRYGDFMAAQGLDAQLEALQASGYATDPNYSRSVGSIARGIAIPQQPTQVASIDPGILRDIPANAGSIDSGILRGLPDGAQNIDPGILRPIPGVGQTGSLPQNAAPGAVMTGPDGRNYMYAETAGMAGATGDYGWIPYNGGGTSEQPAQVAQAGGLNPSIAELLALTGDPNFGYASPAQQQIIQSLIGQNLQEQAQARDPLRQLQLEREALELEQLMNPPAPFQPTPLSAQERAAFGIPEGSGSWVWGEDGMPTQLYASPEDPTSVREYEYYVQQAQAAGQQPVPYVEWDNARKAAGATNISNVVGGAGEVGTIPPGYELFTDPESGARSMRPIEGGPVWQEQLDAEQRAASLAGDQAAYARTVTQDIGVAASYLNEIPEWARGDSIMASNLRAQRANIAGTPEYNMRRFAESALDNVVLDTINRMRQGSSAGATGFGNMNQQQVEIMRGILGRYDPALPIDDQKYIFNRLNNFYMDVQFGTESERAEAVRDGRMTQEENDVIKEFYAPETRDLRGQTIEQPAQSQAGPSIFAPQPGTVEDGYRFKGGDPANPDNWERVQ